MVENNYAVYSCFAPNLLSCLVHPWMEHLIYTWKLLSPDAPEDGSCTKSRSYIASSYGTAGLDWADKSNPHPAAFFGSHDTKLPPRPQCTTTITAPNACAS